MRREDTYDEVTRRIKRLTNTQNATVFSALCAERHAACIATFCALEKQDSRAYLDAISCIWKSVLILQTDQLRMCQVNLLKMIPHDEDFDSAVAGQAQLGLLCANHCIDILLDGDPTLASGSSDNALASAEQVANYLNTRVRRQTFIEKSVQAELTKREIHKQLLDLDELSLGQQVTAGLLNQLRDTNFQYIIPPALICWAPDVTQ